MMQFFALLDAFGVPTVVSASHRPEMVEVPEGVDPLTVYFKDGAWGDRPAVTVTTTGPLVTLGGVPDGTELEVVDVETNVVLMLVTLAGDEVISFEDPGTYQISVAPPPPYLRWDGVLQC